MELPKRCYETVSSLIILIFLLIGAVLFIPAVRTLFDEFTKTPQQREKERARAKQLADEGLQDKFARFLFGNNFVDKSKSNKAAKLQEEANHKIREQQAKNHGFKSIAEFEKATDPNRNITKFNPKGIIGYDEYQVKIWILSHMDMQGTIDDQGFGKFSCKSFMEKNKLYQDLLDEVNELVAKKLLFVTDANAQIKQYRITGDSQYEFQRLILGAIQQMRKSKPYLIAELFKECLDEENERNFLTSKPNEFFQQIKQDDNHIKQFLKDYLIQNASSYATFLLSLFVKL